MSKKTNYQILNQHSTYTSTELAKILKRSRHTVHYWVKYGTLTPLNPEEHTWLFSGADVKKYFKERNMKSKVILKIDQVYCLSCRLGMRVRTDSLVIKFTGKKIGKSGAEQIIIYGLCVTCGHKCRKLSSSNRIDEFLSNYPGYSK